jgi:DNA-binding transcriptional ArsR family regulator
MAFGKYVEMTEPSAIRALAHPARMAILAYLDEGPATATECSTAADESPSACSYHLRTLARLGFVEQVPSDDGRERRWQLKIHGHGIPKSAQDSPKVRAAARIWGRQWVAIEQRILAQYLATEAKEPADWQKATTFYSFEAYLTPEELIKVGDRIKAMIDRYSSRAENKRPSGARPVHISLTAFPRPEDSALRRKAAVRRKEDRGRAK